MKIQRYNSFCKKKGTEKRYEKKGGLSMTLKEIFYTLFIQAGFDSADSDNEE